MEEEKKQYAVLIDADNISSKYAGSIFDELNTYGYASCRRIYGNWARSNGWSEDVLLEYSIMPIQQFSYTTGKNATDMAMVIDAMDLLYSDKVDGFCIVTSDSDFTRLAMRLREENKFVIGMGESKTPLALTRACNKFIHLNLISDQEKSEGNVGSSGRTGVTVTEEDSVTSINEIEAALLALIAENGDKAMELAVIGNKLSEKFSDFDVRNYGYAKLSVFISEEMPNIALEQKNAKYFVEKKMALNRETIEKEIIQYIEKNGGAVENLAVINDVLKSRHSHFDLKDYGYSRLSSFLRSIGGITVNANKVRLKERAVQGNETDSKSSTKARRPEKRKTEVKKRQEDPKDEQQ